MLLSPAQQCREGRGRELRHNLDRSTVPGEESGLHSTLRAAAGVMVCDWIDEIDLLTAGHTAQDGAPASRPRTNQAFAHSWDKIAASLSRPLVAHQALTRHAPLPSVPTPPPTSHRPSAATAGPPS